MAERAAANDLTEHDKVLCELTLAWCDRDAEAIRRTLQATDLSRITNSGFAYPKAWFEALAERIRGDNVARKGLLLVPVRMSKMQCSVILAMVAYWVYSR